MSAREHMRLTIARICLQKQPTKRCTLLTRHTVQSPVYAVLTESCGLAVTPLLERRLTFRLIVHLHTATRIPTDSARDAAAVCGRS